MSLNSNTPIEGQKATSSSSPSVSSLSSSTSISSSDEHHHDHLPPQQHHRSRKLRMEDLSRPSEVLYSSHASSSSSAAGDTSSQSSSTASSSHSNGINSGSGHPWYKTSAKYLTLGLYQPSSSSASSSRSSSASSTRSDGGPSDSLPHLTAVGANSNNSDAIVPKVRMGDRLPTANEPSELRGDAIAVAAAAAGAASTSGSGSSSSGASGEGDDGDDDEAPADPEAATVAQSSAASPPEPPRSFKSDLKGNMGTLLCGFVAGCVSRTTTAPLDRVKILVQEGHNLHKMIQPKNPDPAVEAKSYRRLPRCETPTVKDVLLFIYREDGVKGYFKGNGVNCFKAGLESGVVFTVRKRLNDLVEKRKAYERTATYVSPLGALMAKATGTEQFPLEPLQVTGGDKVYGHNVPIPRLPDTMKLSSSSSSDADDAGWNPRFLSAQFAKDGAPGLSLLGDARVIRKVPTAAAASGSERRSAVVRIMPPTADEEGSLAALSSFLKKDSECVLSIAAASLPTTTRDDHYKLFYYKQLAAVRSKAGGGGEGAKRDPTIYVSVSSLPSLLPNFCIGSASGATAQILLYPLELIKTRIAVAQKGEFSGGVRECITYTYRSGGVKEFYKGLTPNLAGIIPYRGLEVGIFYTVQGAALRRHRAHSEHSHKHLTAWETAGIGTLASVIAQTATYPLNVIRTRLQTQGVNNRPKIYKGMTDCFMHLMKNEGLPGLFRGLTANYLKAVPASAITFVVFEEMQKLIGE